MLSIMRIAGTIPPLLLTFCLVCLAGCQGPTLQQRIASNQTDFESWPAEVRQAVSEGRIEVGFKPRASPHGVG